MVRYTVRTALGMPMTRLLLRIRRERLSGLIDQYPRLSGSRDLLSGTHLLSKMVNLDWLNHDERVILINRKNPFFLTTRVLIPCLVVLTGLIILLLNLQGITHMPQSVIIGMAVTVAVCTDLDLLDFLGLVQRLLHINL